MWQISGYHVERASLIAPNYLYNDDSNTIDIIIDSEQNNKYNIVFKEIQLLTLFFFIFKAPIWF